jgi:hypothetical protein
VKPYLQNFPMLMHEHEHLGKVAGKAANAGMAVRKPV